MPEPQDYRLQLLIEPRARAEADKQALKQELRRLGIEVSGEGAATLSGRIAPADFARLFDRRSRDALAADPLNAELPVPDALRGRVTAITLAPPHLDLE